MDRIKLNIATIIALALSTIAFAQTGATYIYTQNSSDGLVRVDVGEAIWKAEAGEVRNIDNPHPEYALALAYRDAVGFATYTVDGNGNLVGKSNGGVVAKRIVRDAVISESRAQAVAKSLGVDVNAITASGEFTESKAVQLLTDNAVEYWTTIDPDGALVIKYVITVSDGGKSITGSGSIRIPTLSLEYLKFLKYNADKSAAFRLAAQQQYQNAYTQSYYSSSYSYSWSPTWGMPILRSGTVIIGEPIFIY